PPPSSGPSLPSSPPSGRASTPGSSSVVRPAAGRQGIGRRLVEAPWRPSPRSTTTSRASVPSCACADHRTVGPTGRAAGVLRGIAAGRGGLGAPSRPGPPRVARRGAVVTGSRHAERDPGRRMLVVVPPYVGERAATAPPRGARAAGWLVRPLHRRRGDHLRGAPRRIPGARGPRAAATVRVRAGRDAGAQRPADGAPRGSLPRQLPLTAVRDRAVRAAAGLRAAGAHGGARGLGGGGADPVGLGAARRAVRGLPHLHRALRTATPASRSGCGGGAGLGPDPREGAAAAAQPAGPRA